MKFYINPFVAVNNTNMILLITKHQTVALGAKLRTPLFDSFNMNGLVIVFNPYGLSPTRGWWMTKKLDFVPTHRHTNEVNAIHESYLTRCI